MLIEKSKATQWRLQPAINRRILPSVVLKTQKCQCAQENNRQLLSFALFHICSHPPSPKPDDTAWGIPLQRRSQMVHFWMDWRRQHGSGCRRSSWTVPYSAPESAVMCTIIIWGSCLTRLQHLPCSCAFPYTVQKLALSLWENQSVKWFENRIASLCSALNPIRLSFGALREIANS